MRMDAVKDILSLPLLTIVEKRLKKSLLPLPLNNRNAEPCCGLSHLLALHHPGKDLPHQLHQGPARQPNQIVSLVSLTFYAFSN